VSWYGTYVLPRLIDRAMRTKVATAERQRLVPSARGAVLEVGAGSGLNIPLYGSEVNRLYALDPSAELLRMARRRARGASFPIEWLEGSGEQIPLGDDCVDTVVSTWTLCSIADPGRALAEIARVLKPGGEFVFIEHGRSPDPGVSRWQDRLTPVWRHVAGGCHLNRKIDDLIRAGGFDIAELASGYVQGPRVGSYLYRGRARRGSEL
jgi:ubiquinone/menaquinone biosynthesis C-methylase UbiE